VEYTILSLLKANPNINQKRLSLAINVSPPNMATLLDRLEARDLLSRQRNPLDKRSQILVLTPEGLRICTKGEKTLGELDLDATAALSDQERSELIRLLQKMFMPTVE
jgi:DNA-binding MarR family transcriptional regulator